MEWGKVRDQLRTELYRLEALSGAADLIEQFDKLRAEIPYLQGQIEKIKPGVEKAQAELAESTDKLNFHRVKAAKEVKDHNDLIGTLSEKVRGFKADLTITTDLLTATKAELAGLDAKIRERKASLEGLTSQEKITAQKVRDLDGELKRLTANVGKILAVS